jgi:nifR3 family TIM-barrel protein
MKIGNVKIKNGFLLAPMAGFSTPPFRRLCHEFGAGLTTSEMVSSEAVVHHNPRTLASLERAKDERPFAIQIVGSEPLSISLAATILQPRCEIVDINLGCPACAVTGQGAGAALLDDPAKIARIFDSLTVLKIPYTAKMRLGFSTKENAVHIARIIEKGGASALTVHGRTAKQGYKTPCDLAAIKEIKKALSIPVVGNGDVSSPEVAEAMMRDTGCDGVNPFLFRQLVDYFKDGDYLVPTPKERAAALGRFLSYAAKDPLSVVRLQAVQFVSDVDDATTLRHRIARAKTMGEIEDAARDFGRS